MSPGCFSPPGEPEDTSSSTREGDSSTLKSAALEMESDLGPHMDAELCVFPDLMQMV